LFHSSSDKYKINRYYEQTPKSKDRRLMWIIKGELNPPSSSFIKGGERIPPFSKVDLVGL